VGFEPKIPALERAKKIHALGSATTVIDTLHKLGNSKASLNKARINEMKIRGTLPHFHFSLYSMTEKNQPRKTQSGYLASVQITEPGTRQRH
jgi:hypothetical protein